MSWSHEFESSASAPSLFHAMVVDWHSVAPKVLPDLVSGAALEGDGSVGSVRQINFTSAYAKPSSFIKEHIDYIDHGKFESKLSVIKSSGIDTTLDSSSYHYKFEPTSRGGSVLKVAATYKTVPGVSGAQVTGEIAKWKETLSGMIKATEAYIKANPGAYA